MNGFSRDGGVTIWTCPASAMEPQNWPGVISWDESLRCWIKDGRRYDPELDGAPRSEIEAMSYQPDGPEIVTVDGEDVYLDEAGECP